jgi:hypothetical protein
LVVSLVEVEGDVGSLSFWLGEGELVAVGTAGSGSTLCCGEEEQDRSE